MASTHTGPSRELLEPLRRGVGRDNPVLYQVLGICSALAVTDRLGPALVLSVSLMIVAACSAGMISLLRKFTPHRVRLIVQMLVISTFVIVIDLYLQAYWPLMRSELGVYLELIITNCLVLGRCEGYAMRHRPIPAMLDALGAGAGYGIVLAAVAVIREPLGSGSLLGRPLFDGFVPFGLLGEFPGAFITLGVVVWIVKAVWPDVGEDACTHCAGHTEARR